MVKKYYRDISSQNYSIPRRYFMDGLVSVLDIGGTYRANLDYRCRVLDTLRAKATQILAQN
jgi:hypothetical protein